MMLTSEVMARCDACGTPYAWRRSTSRLKFTACSSFCERKLLGCTFDDIMAVERSEALHSAKAALAAIEVEEWDPEGPWEEAIGYGPGKVPDL